MPYEVGNVAIASTETSDSNDCEWMEWVPIPADAEATGLELTASVERNG